jgi:phospholipase/carboxylesterase
MSTAHTVEMDGWTVRVLQPNGTGLHPVVVMLHGWTGDENAMWIFASRLPQNSLVIAPRAPYREPSGGFSWHLRRQGGWPRLVDLKPSVAALLELLRPENFPAANLERFDLLGFSQGAALGCSLALLHPERIRSLEVLSGFVPEDAGSLAAAQPLCGLPVFMAHGTRDELVPVERARQGRDLLLAAGADLQYCEHEAGHKLNASCFRSLQEFIAGVQPRTS